MKRGLCSAVLAIGVTVAGYVRGQPAGLASASSLVARFGVDDAARLMRSNDANDRLRGIERAAALRTADALLLLDRAARTRSGEGGLDPRMPADGFARGDPRAVLAVVRGLSEWDSDKARTALLSILAAPSDAFAARVAAAKTPDPAGDEADGIARIALARREAAMALSTMGESALEALVATARSGGPGQEAALDALAAHPPVGPLALGGVALTTPATIGLAATIGDLRALDAILGVVRASDPALRAAAITGLGEAGDSRGIEVARPALHDPDPGVRLAATQALVRLGARDAEPALEGLIADDATARPALVIAQGVQDEGITKSAAARAVASADPEIRATAVATLGRQSSEAAIEVLVALTADPLLQSDAAYALARSPNPNALAAIEGLVSRGTTGAKQATFSADALRRLAARAYFARRILRGERSGVLDTLLSSLAMSSDPRDRAVGSEALVAFGERSLERVLADPDARVRRAGAMGAMGQRGERRAATLLARLATESDEPTRRVLALGLLNRDASRAVPSSMLLTRSTAGGPDAPLAALALAERDDDALAAHVDALLSSRDPLLRASAGRGLSLSPERNATGRLANAYAWEADAVVRRAVICSLASRDVGPVRDATLRLAARLDPDARVRWIAARAVSRRYVNPPAEETGIPEVAWIRLVPADGAAGLREEGAVLALSDGMAIPIVFDDEGYALVPGIPPGEAQLRLAPALPAYSLVVP